MNYRLFLCLFVLPFLAHAQFPVSPNALTESGLRTGQWTILYDSTFQREVTDPDSVVYYRLIRFEDGKPSGKVRDFYRSGQKQWDGYVLSVKPDKFDGECRHYHQNGKVSTITNYKDGAFEGPYREYSVKGELTAEGQFENGESTGKWIFYFPGGKKKSESYRVRGLDHGPMTFWFESGQVSVNGMMVDNNREGIWDRYFENGKLQSRSNYVKGKYHGFSEEYYENGILKEKGECKDGYYDGFWAHYRDNGKKESEGKYIVGSSSGTWKDYDVNGILSAEYEMKNGKLNGPYTAYYSNGKTYCKGFYENSRKKRYWIFYSETSQPISEGNYFDTDTLDGVWKYYHENGALKSIGEHVRGIKEGKWYEYYERGALEQEDNFVKGKLQGESVEYYEDGTISKKLKYDQDTEHGMHLTHHANGQLNEKGEYDHDVQIGEWISYHNNGKVDEWRNYVKGVLDGRYESHYANGNPKKTGTYDLGKKIGTWEEFFEDGTRSRIDKYDNGKYSWVTYYPNGSKKYESQGIGTGSDNTEQGLKKEYYSNGKLRVEGRKINGFSEGIYIFYDSITGKKEQEGAYKLGEYDGVWKIYNAKGKVKSRIYFISGFRENISNVRDSINSLIEVRDYAAATQKLEWFKKVLKRDAAENDPSWTSLYKLQGDIHYGLDEFELSLKYFQQYAEAVKKLESDTTYRYLLALNGMANAYSGMKEYAESFRMNSELTELTKNNPDNYPTYSYNKALDLYYLKRSDEAEAGLISVWERYKNEYGQTHENTLMALKYLSRFQGEFLDKYRESLEGYKYIQQHLDSLNENYLVALRKISLRYKELDSVTKSNEWLLKAIQYQETHKLDKYKNYLDDVIRLTEQYFAQNKYELAASALLKGITAIRKYSSIETVEGAKLLSSAGRIYTSLNYDSKLSIEYGEKAKAILEKLGKKNISLYESVLSQLADAHFDDPLTYAQAEKYYKELIVYAAHEYGTSAGIYYTKILLLANYYTNGFKVSKSDSLLYTIRDIRQRFDSSVYVIPYYDRIKGDLALFQYKYKDALAHYTAAGEFYKRTEGLQSKMYARALINQASTLGMWGKKAEAQVLTEQAIKIFEKRGETETPEYVGLQDKLADLYTEQLLYNEASELHKTVIKSTLFFYGEDHIKYRAALLKQGVLQVKLNEYKKAEESLTRVATLAFKNTTGANEQNYFKALQELASLKVLQQDVDAASAYFSKAKTAGAFYGDDVWYYLFLDRYAKFCAEHNRSVLAESLFLEALAITKRVTGENHWFYASVGSELAKVYQQLGKTAEAEKMVAVALAYAERNRSEDEETYISGLETVALNMRRMGRFEDAEKLYTKVIEFVSVKNPNTNRYAVKLIDMASLQLDWKKYERVIELLTPAMAIMKENLPEDHENILTAYNQLGLSYLELNKLDSSYYLFKFCVDRRKANGRANTYSQMISLHNLGYTLMRLGKFSEAERLYHESSEVISKNKIEINLQIQATLIDDYGILYQAWGKPELAEKYWKEALQKSLTYIRTNFSFLSDYEKAKFWERNKADFEYFNTFAVQRSTTNPAITGDMYNYRLATKGILLSASNKLRKRIYASRDSLLISQYYAWTELREQAAKEYAIAKSDQKTPRLDSLEQSINILEKELSISTEDNSAEREQLVTWKVVQQTLGADEAAVELIRFRYFDRKVTDSVIYAALVITKETKSSPKLIVLKKGDYLEGSAYKYYRNCILGQVDDEFSYSNFWQPIESAVQNKKRIYISLDGVYNQISLKTLRLPDGSYLMDSRDFIIVSNTRDLVALKGRKKLKFLETASLIGNPKFYVKSATNQMRGADEDRSGIVELPGTKVEIESVQNLLQTKGWKVNALVQQEATEDNVKQLPASRIVHLATHGFFQDERKSSWSTEDPMLRSGVILTGGANSMQDENLSQTEDGILTAYEAANLSLEGTELVVLSACETARGEIKQGEGVYGLQRAFITAGAESLVMSLWKVDDAATQKLMSLFYQNLMLGMEKSEALTQAQRELKKLYPNPFYWGAFVMMRG